MAYVKRHAIKSTLLKAIKYITNEKKTDNKLFVTSNKCSTNEKLAYIEMRQLKKKYDKEDGILGFHFIQSFKPQETDIKTAHQVGQEWANAFLEDKYQYVLTTHIDKGHIHNHLIINSVGLDGKKYNSCINEREDIRAYSDVICRKYGLSIIQRKNKNKTMSYKEWLENKNKTSWKQIIKEDIDNYISIANSFEDFLKLMRENGYYIKQGKNVKYMTFKKSNMKRCIRGKTLGENYSEENIKKRIKLKEHDINTVRLKQYKYRGNKKEWDNIFKVASYKYPTLKTNMLLISLLLNVLFNKNKKYKNVSNNYVEKQKILSKEIDNITNQLNYIDKFNIKSKKDLHRLIDIKKEDVIFKKDIIKKYNNLYQKADAISVEIDLYNKYRKYHEEYQKSILKGVYKNKHCYELEKFKQCNEKLIKLGLKNKNDYENLFKKKEEITKKIEEVNREIYSDYEKIERLESVNKSLDVNRRQNIIINSSIDRSEFKKEKEI